MRVIKGLPQETLVHRRCARMTRWVLSVATHLVIPIMPGLLEGRLHRLVGLSHRCQCAIGSGDQSHDHTAVRPEPLEHLSKILWIIRHFGSGTETSMCHTGNVSILACASPTTRYLNVNLVLFSVHTRSMTRSSFSFLSTMVQSARLRC